MLRYKKKASLRITYANKREEYIKIRCYLCNIQELATLQYRNQSYLKDIYIWFGKKTRQNI